MKYIRIILSSLLVVAGLLIFVNFASGFFFKSSLFNAYIVQSGSMEPSIKTGSLVISLPSKNYSQNDVITYKDGKKLVTHRIEAKLFPEGVYSDPIYMTSGDANKSLDRIKLSQDQIVGKVLFSVPYLGYVADFAKTPKGFILFVVIPATIIVYEELKFLFISIISRIREKIKKNSVSNNTNIGIYSKLLAVIPIFGAIIVFVGLTNSFFADDELSAQNVFQAAVFSTPTPTAIPTPAIANHLVINEVLYDTASDQDISGQGGSNRGEWIEIYNPTLASVNVNNWTIEDNTSSETLPNITILAGGFLILTGATESEFEGIWTVPSSVQYAQASGGTIGNGFNNAGDRASLKDNLSNIIDQVSWGGDTTFLNPAPPDVATGHSLERDPDGVDTDTNADFVDRTTPTPGT